MSYAQLGTAARLRGALLGRDRPNHFGLLSLVVYIMGSGQEVTCWEEIRRYHLHKSPNQMGQLGVVSIQHHRAEVFLEEVNGEGGRTPGYDVKLHPAVILYMREFEASLYIYHSCLPTLRVTRLPQPGWQSWMATTHKLMVWCPSYCGLADDPFFVRTTARQTARVRERRHTQMPLKN